MKILWLIPITVDRTFQFTSKNELARALRDLGHEVETVVAYREDQTPLDGFSKVVYVQTKDNSPPHGLRFHWCMLHAALRTNADAVMFGFQAGHLIPFAYWRGLWEKRPKFVLDVRTIPVDLESSWRSNLEVMRYNLGLRAADCFCDGITVITPMLGETARQRLKRLAARIGVWTSGVCLDHFEPEGPDMRQELGLESKRVLFHHGTLSPNRGLQQAIQAFGLLKDRIPDLVFLLVGDGKAKKELQMAARETGAQDRILFTGKVPYREISKYLRTCDVAILPFPDMDWWAVSSPIKLMEYLAMGVRVVATDIPAHRWLEQQTGGVMFADNSSPVVLAAAISRVLEQSPCPVPRADLEETISWHRQAERLVEFISSL